MFLQMPPRHQGPLLRGKRILSNLDIFVEKYFIHMQIEAHRCFSAPCSSHVLNLIASSFHIDSRGVAKCFE